MLEFTALCSYVNRKNKIKMTKMEILKGSGVNDFGIWRAWGRAFWNLQRQVGLKCLCHPWKGIGYFLESSFQW